MLDAVMTSGEGSPECTSSRAPWNLGSLGVGISGSAQPTAPQLLEGNGAPSDPRCNLPCQCKFDPTQSLSESPSPLVRQCPAVWPRKAAGDSAVPWAHADWDRRQDAASTGRSGNCQWGLTVHNNKNLKLIRGVSSILHKRWSTRLSYSVALVIRSRVTLAQGVATLL